MDASEVLSVIRTACPEAVGVAVVDPDDRSTWRVDFSDGTTDTQRAAAATALAAYVPSTAPRVVTRLQGRLALDAAGLLVGVEAAVAASDKATQIWYADAPNWRRDDPILARLAAALGLADAQVNALFVQAEAE